MRIYVAEHLSTVALSPRESGGTLYPGWYWLKKGYCSREDYGRVFNQFGQDIGPMVFTMGWSYIDRKGVLRAGRTPWHRSYMYRIYLKAKMFRSKRRLINKYYNLLMWLEDVLSAVEVGVNEHRKHIDEKYWDKYIKPNNETDGCREVSE